MIKKLIGYGILLALFTGLFATHTAMFGVIVTAVLWTTAAILTVLIAVAIMLIVG